MLLLAGKFQRIQYLVRSLTGDTPVYFATGNNQYVYIVFIDCLSTDPLWDIVAVKCRHVSSSSHQKSVRLLVIISSLVHHYSD